MVLRKHYEPKIQNSYWKREYINILYLVHSDRNAVMVARAGQLRRARNLVTKDDSEATKVFNTSKTGGRGDQCRPKLRWLDSTDRNTYI